MSGVAALVLLLSFDATADKHAHGVEFFKQHRYLDAIAELQAALQTEEKGSTNYNE